VRPTNIWFPAKRYGWGWGLPVSWQGWVVLAAFALLIVVGILLFPPTRDTVAFVIYVIALNVVLVAICYAKGEKPSWRWGGDR
jgi:hypothetical protein